MTKTDPRCKLPANHSEIAIFFPNPVLDIVLTYNQKSFKEVKKYADNVIYSAGGMGFNVARTVIGLGGQAKVFTLLGSSVGAIISTQAIAERIPFFNVLTTSDSRVAVIPIAKKLRRELMFVSPSPAISASYVKKLTEAMLDSIDQYSILAIGGSLPRKVGRIHYPNLIKVAQSKGVPVFVDTRNEALLAALSAKPWAIKLNLAEAAFLLSKKSADIKEIACLCKKLHKKGIKIPIVTLGEKGAIVWLEDTAFLFSPQKVSNPLSSFGAGDSFDGGFLFGIINGRDVLDAIKLGIACGVVKTELAVPGACDAERAKKMINKITVEKIGVSD
jgi:1-phosphofructokinase family hexose kinase